MIILLYFDDNFVLFSYFLVAIGCPLQSPRPRRAELDVLALQRNPKVIHAYKGANPRTAIRSRLTEGQRVLLL